jgi:hypothetical protein
MFLEVDFMSRRLVGLVAVLLLVAAVPAEAARLKSRRPQVAPRESGGLTALWTWAAATLGVTAPGISISTEDSDAGWQMDPNGAPPAPKH